MDFELRLWRNCLRLIPNMRGKGVIMNQLIRFYGRKIRQNLLILPVMDFKMELDLAQNVDSGIAFGEDLYDFFEFNFLKKNLKKGDFFADLGANIGFYTVRCAKMVGDQGRILAIDADPISFDRLSKNVAMNDFKNVTLVKSGLSDCTETLTMGINPTNRGGNSFLQFYTSKTTVELACRTLLSILNEQKIDRLDGMKIDIEGYEFKVLKHFFSNAPTTLFPKFIIMEYQQVWDEKAGGSSIELILSYGYKLVGKKSVNYIYALGI